MDKNNINNNNDNNGNKKSRFNIEGNIITKRNSIKKKI